jgi:hypothetical protein
VRFLFLCLQPPPLLQPPFLPRTGSSLSVEVRIAPRPQQSPSCIASSSSSSSSFLPSAYLPSSFPSSFLPSSFLPSLFPSSVFVEGADD